MIPSILRGLLATLLLIGASSEAKAQSGVAPSYATASEAKAACEAEASFSPGSICFWKAADSGWCDGTNPCYRPFFWWVSGGEWYGILSGHTYASSCPESDPDCAPELVDTGKAAAAPCDPGCGFADPINPSTGNKYDSKTEYRSPRGLLELTWTYNALPLIQTALRTWPLGAQRTHNLHTSVHVVGSSGNLAYVLRGDGRAFPFAKDGSAWVSTPDVVGRLTELKDGGGNTVGWEFRDGDGRLERFGSSGRLERVIQGGHTLDLAYSAGQLTRVEDETGRAIEFTYVAGRMDRAELPDGRVLSFSYDGSGNLSEVTTNGTDSIEYHYNEATYTGGATLPHALTRIVDEAGISYSMTTYDAAGRATGNWLAGNVENYTIQYVLSEDGTYAQASVGTEPSGSHLVQGFTSILGNPLPTSVSRECSDGCAQSRLVRYSYDANGRVSRRIDESGTRFDYTYDADGLLTLRIDAVGSPEQRRTETTWDGTHRLPTSRKVFDAANVERSRLAWNYNARGQLLWARVVDPATGQYRQTSLSYCEAGDVSAGTCPRVGLLLQVDGPRTDVSDTVSYVYRAANAASCTTDPTGCPYRKGDLWKVTNALGHVTEISAYDGAGRPLSVKDANGVTTDITYTPAGQVASRTVRGNPAHGTSDRTWTMTYTPTGLLAKSEGPDGSFLEFEYDHARRLVAVQDNLGEAIEFTLDAAGNVTYEQTTDDLGTIKHYVTNYLNSFGEIYGGYDGRGSYTGFTYDAAGSVTNVHDGNGRDHERAYDALGRLKKSVENRYGTGVNKAQSLFGYDALDRLISVTDPKGLLTQYGFNAYGDLTSLTSPDTGTSTWTHDAAGNPIQRTDARGVVTAYSHDALGRLLALDVPTSGEDSSYSYDVAPGFCPSAATHAVGRLAQAQNAAATLSYCYDDEGRIARKRQAVASGPTGDVAYAYSAGGHLASIEYPSGALVSYERDALGRITAIRFKATPASAQQDLVIAARHLPFGPLAGITFGNGRTLDRTFNAAYTIDGIADSQGDGVQLTLSKDPLDNVTAVDERTSASTTLYRWMGYDGQNRLTTMEGGGVTKETFTYDATGNRLSKRKGSLANYSYGASSHRLNQVGTVARTYDAAGNTTAIGPQLFTYDDYGRLRSVGTSGGATHAYRHNPRGERVSKQPLASGSATYFVYDEAGRLLGEYTAGGAALKEYVWLDDTLVAILGAHAGTGHQYVLTDHLGTPRAVARPDTNAIVWRWNLSTTAFGDHAPLGNPDGDAHTYTLNLRYPGQYFDAESGLHYNYFRDYEPGTGRYVQSDPIGLAGGMSTYAYVASNPLLRIDPIGLRGMRPAFRQPPNHYSLQNGKWVGIAAPPGSQPMPRRYFYSNLHAERASVTVQTAPWRSVGFWPGDEYDDLNIELNSISCPVIVCGIGADQQFGLTCPDPRSIRPVAHATGDSAITCKCL